MPFSDAGLYWTTPPHPTVPPAGATEVETVIIAGPGRVAMLAEELLLDARLSKPSALLRTNLGLDEVTRQHFNIPVTASGGALDPYAAAGGVLITLKKWYNAFDRNRNEQYGWVT